MTNNKQISTKLAQYGLSLLNEPEMLDKAAAVFKTAEAVDRGYPLSGAVREFFPKEEWNTVTDELYKQAAPTADELMQWLQMRDPVTGNSQYDTIRNYYLENDRLKHNIRTITSKLRNTKNYLQSAQLRADLKQTQDQLRLNEDGFKRAIRQNRLLKQYYAQQGLSGQWNRLSDWGRSLIGGNSGTKQVQNEVFNRILTDADKTQAQRRDHTARLKMEAKAKADAAAAAKQQAADEAAAKQQARNEATKAQQKMYDRIYSSVGEDIRTIKADYEARAARGEFPIGAAEDINASKSHGHQYKVMRTPAGEIVVQPRTLTSAEGYNPSTWNQAEQKRFITEGRNAITANNIDLKQHFPMQPTVTPSVQTPTQPVAQPVTQFQAGEPLKNQFTPQGQPINNTPRIRRSKSFANRLGMTSFGQDAKLWNKGYHGRAVARMGTKGLAAAGALMAADWVGRRLYGGGNKEAQGGGGGSSGNSDNNISVYD